jgi:glutaredoxin
MPNTPSAQPALHVCLYTRRVCRSCDTTRAMIEQLRGEWQFSLEIVDVDSDPALSESVGCSVPLVTVNGGNQVAVRIDEDRLRRALQRASERAARATP